MYKLIKLAEEFEQESKKNSPYRIAPAHHEIDSSPYEPTEEEQYVNYINTFHNENLFLRPDVLFYKKFGHESDSELKALIVNAEVQYIFKTAMNVMENAFSNPEEYSEIMEAYNEYFKVNPSFAPVVDVIRVGDNFQVQLETNSYIKELGEGPSSKIALLLAAQIAQSQ